jgi:RING finger protein 121/175
MPPAPGAEDPHAGHGHAMGGDGGAPLHPLGPHTHEHTVDGVTHAHVHDPARDGLVFWLMMLGLGGMQLGLKWWKQRHPRSFQVVSLGGLWAFPAVSAAVGGGWRFLVAWALFTAACAYYLRLARQKPLQPRTPKRVYSFFDVAYRLGSATAMWSYSIVVVLVLAPPLQLLVPQVVVDALVAGMLAGTYFCVITRDVTELAAETMSSTLGYAKSQLKRRKDDDGDGGGGSVRPVPRGLCALCGDDLKAAGEGSAEEEGIVSPLDRQTAAPSPATVAARSSPLGGGAGAGRRRGAAPDAAPAKRTVKLRGAGGETLYRLECDHTFHSHCIKGWCVVGKKGMCPCCLERVDLRAIVGDTLWATPSVLWTQVLDGVRYAVVWLPVLVFGLRFVLYEAGVDLTTVIVKTAANGTAANATGAVLAVAGGGGGDGAAAAAAAAAVATAAAAAAVAPAQDAPPPPALGGDAETLGGGGGGGGDGVAPAANEPRDGDGGAHADAPAPGHDG